MPDNFLRLCWAGFLHGSPLWTLLLIPAIWAFEYCDRWWGADHMKTQAKMLIATTAMLLWLAAGPLGYAIPLVWWAHRSIGNFTDLMTPISSKSRWQCILLHGIVVPPLVALFYWLASPQAAVGALLLYSGYVSTAVMLAFEYGDMTALARAGQPPTGIGTFNTYVEKRRGASFGAATTGALAVAYLISGQNAWVDGLWASLHL